MSETTLDHEQLDGLGDGHTPGVPLSKPVIADGFIAPRLMIPSQEWLRENITAKPPGTRVALGRIWGYAIKAEDKSNDHQGKKLESIALQGAFEAENLLTGELTTAPTLYLPMSFARQAKDALTNQGMDRIVMHIGVAVEATGKNIPHRYVIASLVDMGMNKGLAALRDALVPALDTWGTTRTQTKAVSTEPAKAIANA